MMLDEAHNTITAGRLELIGARLFGKKRTTYDGLFWVKTASWRGRTYLLSHSKVSPNTLPDSGQR